MRKLLGLILALVFVAVGVVSPASSLAAPPRSCDPVKEKTIDFAPGQPICIPVTANPTTNALGFSAGLYAYGLGLIGVVGILFVVYGGYVILSSQGNPEKLNKGKSYIYYAIAGIILAFSGFVLYQVIGSDIFNIPGFK